VNPIILRERALLSPGQLTELGDAVVRDLTRLGWLAKSDFGLAVEAVGVYSYGTTEVVFLPKCILPDEPSLTPRQLVQIVRTLRRALLRLSRELATLSPEARPVGALVDIERGQLSALAEALFTDYRAHGLLSVRHGRLVTNGDGETDWARTVSRHLPIHIPDGVFYPDADTRVVAVDAEAFIARIHRWALAFCADSFSLVADPPDLGWTPESLARIGSVRSVLARIDVARRVTFADRELNVLGLVSRLVLSIAGESRNYSRLGSTSFHTVWEAALRHLLHHDSQLLKWRELPRWTAQDLDGEDRYLLPDVLGVFQLESGAKGLLLADAKYYAPDPGAKVGLGWLPGSPDIIKQFAYELSLQGQLLTHTDVSRILNCFVVPRGDVGETMGVDPCTEIVAEARFVPNRLGGVIKVFSLPLLGVLDRYYRELPLFRSSVAALVSAHGRPTRQSGDTGLPLLPA
jgi:hypothetical protein